MRFSLRTLVFVSPVIVAALAASPAGHAWVDAQHGPAIADTLFALLGLNALAVGVLALLMTVADHT